MDTHNSVLLTFVALVAVGVIVFLVWPKSKGKEGFDQRECDIFKNNIGYVAVENAASNAGELYDYYSSLSPCDAECTLQQALAQQAYINYVNQANQLGPYIDAYPPCQEPAPTIDLDRIPGREPERKPPGYYPMEQPSRPPKY